MLKSKFPSDVPMSPADATECLRSFYKEELEIRWTRHAKEQMAERKLLMGDVLHILKLGFVLLEAEKSTAEGYFKYKMEATTPNSGGRTVVIVIIPGGFYQIKICTVYWKDER